MDLKSLARNWKWTTSANLLLSVAVCASVLANMGLVGKIASMHERLVLVPPMMTKETKIGWNSAEKDYFEGWGLYTASMIGSATPKTASFVADHLKFIMDPAIYPVVKTQLLSLEKDPSYTRTGSVNLFTPTTVTWEAETNSLFVTGNLTSTAYRGKTTTLANVVVSYQMTMEMYAGAPRITFFTSYAGQPRTLKWTQGNPGEVARVQKEKDDKAMQIAPQESEIQKAIEAGEGSISNTADVVHGADQAVDNAVKPLNKPANGVSTGAATGTAAQEVVDPKSKPQPIVVPSAPPQRKPVTNQENL